MQRKTVAILSLVCLALLAAGGAYFFFWGDSDEKIINRKLDELVELAEKDGEESPFVALGDSGKILTYIALEPDVELGSPLPAIQDRQELRGVIVQVRQNLQSLRIRILKRDLLVAEDRQSAVMEVEAEGTATYSGESGRERRQFTVDWIREEGEWVIQKVRMERML